MGFAVLSGAIVAYYSFVGFETSANVIEEVKSPSKTYPKALFARRDRVEHDHFRV